MRPSDRCGLSRRRAVLWWTGSGGLHGEGVQVVGQDRPAGPDPLAFVASQPAASQPIAALEVADAALTAGAVAGRVAQVGVTPAPSVRLCDLQLLSGRWLGG